MWRLRIEAFLLVAGLLIFTESRSVLNETENVAGFRDETHKSELHMAVFNIEIFGVTKYSKEHVRNVLRDIVLRYDMVMIMEIRDKSETVIYDFQDYVNELTLHDPFSLSVSDRLGRGTSLEQYAYFYRESKLTITDIYQWPDEEDQYMRPPYIARFKPLHPGLSEFGFIPNHVKPSSVVEELDAMVGLYETMATRWDLKDFIMGGDFNAGCRYLSAKKRSELLLVKDERFMWVLDEDSNTTTKNTTCPYDNFILVENDMHERYIEDTGLVYHFDEDFGLSYNETIEVSDHYPVEMKIR